MGLEHGALVGRDGESAELSRVLAEVHGGTARAVFVSGEPGIGKTSVLRELVRQAEARGGLVLEGAPPSSSRIIVGWALAETGEPGRAVELIVDAGG